MQPKLKFALICTSLLSACSAPPKVPVEERSVLTVRQQSEKIGGQLIRIVQPGDTMHSIAFIAGLDVNRVAAWNGIGDTSKLEVGQRIRLTKPIGFVMPALVKTKPVKPERVKTNPINTAPTKTSSNSQNESIAGKPSESPEIAKVRTASQSIKSGQTSWVWPSPGKVIRRFAIAAGQQGIDIQSTKGRAVVASSAGEVVYVGNSLKGYGNLVIVKHSDEFLSAYAHNQKVIVKEGQLVASKQRIGSVGINNRREAALHFQIRKNGRPVNPLTYLPNM